MIASNQTPAQISFTRAQMSEALARNTSELSSEYILQVDLDNFGLLIQKQTFSASWAPVLNSKSDIVYLDRNNSA